MNPPLYLASTIDIPAWGGLIITAVAAVLAGIVFLIRNVGGGGKDDLVDTLKERIDDLEEEVRQERRGREDDNRRHRTEMDDLRRELTNEINTLRAQLVDAYRGRLPRDGEK